MMRSKEILTVVMIDSEEGKMGVSITIQGVFWWVNVLKYMQTINVYKDACVGREKCQS